MAYKAIVIGLSAGGFEALKVILPALPRNFPMAVMVVQHRASHSDEFLTEYFDKICALPVQEAEDKMPIQPGGIYIAPPDYHLLVEHDASFSLSADPRINHSCPSIDALFESAAEVFKESLIGIVLTGANADGAHGISTVHRYNGMTIVQDPATAAASAMPIAALKAVRVDHVLALEQITPLLIELAHLHYGEQYGTGR